VALTGSEEASHLHPRLALPSAWSRLKARLLDAEHLLVQRLAGTVFLIRVASALLAFGSQVLLARWMGSFQFGIYVYVWTWVLLLGQGMDLGLGTAAQRFIPEYRDSGLLALLRGFVSGSRWAALGIAIAIAAFAAGGVRLLDPWLDDYMIIPLYLACMIIPAYALANVQEGIARSYDWFGLSMMPGYVVRQLLLTILMAAAYFAQLPMSSVTAMIVAGVSIWLPTLGQLLVVNWRLARRIEPGPKAYDFKVWLLTALPILMVEGCSPIPISSCCSISGRPRRSPSTMPPPRRSRSCPSSITRYRRRPRIASADITLAAIARDCRPSSPNPSNGRSGLRWRRPRCCCFSAGRCSACSASSSSRVITSCSSSQPGCWRVPPSGRSSGCSTCWGSSASVRWSMPWRSA
jgi:hypothetical protein